MTIDRMEAYEESPAAFMRRVKALVPQHAQLYEFNVLYTNKAWRAQALFYLYRAIERTDESLAQVLRRTPQGHQVFALVQDKLLNGVPVELFEVVASQDKFLGHRFTVYLIRKI